MLFRSLPKVTSETTQSLLTTNRIKSDKFVRVGVRVSSEFHLQTWQHSEIGCDLLANRDLRRGYSRCWQERKIKFLVNFFARPLWRFSRVLTWKQLLSSIQKDLPREAMALNYSYTTSFVNNFDDFYAGLSCLLMDLAQYAPDILFKCCFIAG